MKNKNIKTKVITGLLAGGMLLSISGVALASTNGNSSFIPFKHGKIDAKSMRKPMADNFKTKLDSLVTSGTITQEQEDKITSYIKQKEDEKKAEINRIKSMNAEDRKSYLESNKPQQKQDLIKDLVDQGILTQDQADKVKGTVKIAPQGRPDMKRGFENSFKTQLDAQIKSGVITQDDEDKILTYTKQEEEKRKAEETNLKNMNDEQKKAYFESKKSETRKNIFDNLVEKDILSKEKADALKKALSQLDGPRKTNGDKGAHFAPKGKLTKQ